MRLIDANKLKEEIAYSPLIDFTDDDLFKLIDNQPTVDKSIFDLTNVTSFGEKKDPVRMKFADLEIGSFFLIDEIPHYTAEHYAIKVGPKTYFSMYDRQCFRMDKYMDAECTLLEYEVYC